MAANATTQQTSLPRKLFGGLSAGYRRRFRAGIVYHTSGMKRYGPVVVRVCPDSTRMMAAAKRLALKTGKNQAWQAGISSKASTVSHAGTGPQNACDHPNR